MTTDERMMVGYAKLAEVSRDRRQTAGAHRFLVLCAVAACRAGVLDVAERCRQIVVSANRRHLLSRYESFADALRDEDFEPFRRSLERTLPWERAELALVEVGAAGMLETDADPAEGTRAILEDPAWNA